MMRPAIKSSVSMRHDVTTCSATADRNALRRRTTTAAPWNGFPIHVVLHVVHLLVAFHVNDTAFAATSRTETSEGGVNRPHGPVGWCRKRRHCRCLLFAAAAVDDRDHGVSAFGTFRRKVRVGDAFIVSRVFACCCRVVVVLLSCCFTRCWFVRVVPRVVVVACCFTRCCRCRCHDPRRESTGPKHVKRSRLSAPFFGAESSGLERVKQSWLELENWRERPNRASCLV